MGGGWSERGGTGEGGVGGRGWGLTSSTNFTCRGRALRRNRLFIFGIIKVIEITYGT